MSLSRRFLNLIVDSSCSLGVRTLCRIDLTRQQFFNQGPPPPLNGNGSAADTSCEASKMEKIRLPRPIVTFRASAQDGRWGIQCFPLADRKVLCADQSGRTFLFDADTRHVVTMPNLHKPKHRPFSLFIPSTIDDSHSDPDSDNDSMDYDEGNVGTLFVMEGRPDMETDPSLADQPSDQFEAYIYGQGKPTSFKSWQCQPLPPPPYLRDCTWVKLRPRITSYAVVGGGTQILISAEDAGTYCMDTVTHAWSKVGRWMLPLYGKIEYVPELDLWFGLSAKNQLSAVDLSNLDSRPRLVGTWNEFDPPEDWKQLQGPQLVNLGSGRFCIARFFHTTIDAGGYSGDELLDKTFGVLTGVEVVPRVYKGNGNGNGNGSVNGSNGNGSVNGCNGKGSASSSCNGGNSNGSSNGGKVKLRMVKHKSRCHVSSNGTIINSVF